MNYDSATKFGIGMVCLNVCVFVLITVVVSSTDTKKDKHYDETKTPDNSVSITEK